MIIKLLMDLIYTVFSLLTMPINIPDMPRELSTSVTTLMQYVGTGLGILNNYCNLSYLLILFGVIVLIDTGLLLYKVIMYIIKKIPMLNVS